MMGKGGRRMLYQKLLGGEKPYTARVDRHGSFAPHRHPELEISYCLEGEYFLRIGDVTHRMKPGTLAVVGAMEVHAYDVAETGNLALNIMVGPAFLGGFFDSFSELSPRAPILPSGEADAGSAALRALLEETACLCREGDVFSELQIKGNLYKICAHILKNFPTLREPGTDLRDVACIERALEMIRTRYAEPLRICAVARENGYRESNFCKVFKRVTGETFHAMLNRRRIEVACIYLGETGESIERIAQEVGFADAKIFCRVFRSERGMSPNAWRKERITAVRKKQKEKEEKL